MPLSTATVSMVHSVPELMVSSEVSAARGFQSREWAAGERAGLWSPLSLK